MSTDEQRRLAAIMFAHMVGYSATINSPSRCSKNWRDA
jgi:hypothetical protein